MRDLDAARAEIYASEGDADVVTLRGAGLAVLRSAVYRRLFERGSQLRANHGPQWTGWDDVAINVGGDIVHFAPVVLDRASVRIEGRVV